MLNDFSKKVFQTMTDWANKFYATYGFELDVEPASALRTPNKELLGRAKFVSPLIRRADHPGWSGRPQPLPP